MPISIVTKSPTGAELAYHVLHKVETSHDFTNALIHLRGYATQQGAERGDPLAWMWQLSAPLDSITSLAPPFIEGLLVSDPGSPFFGGTVIAAETPIETSRRLKWMQIKRARDAFEFGSFIWNDHTFDSNPISQQRIQGAAQLAMVSQSMSQPFEFNWTLADNSVVVLNGEEMIQVGMVMGAHIGSAHEKSRLLKAQIDAASTAEQVELIHWV